MIKQENVAEAKKKRWKKKRPRSPGVEKEGFINGG